MGYRVNRVGTSPMFERIPALVMDLTNPFVTSRQYNNTSSNAVVTMPNPSVIKQYNSVHVTGINNGTFTADQVFSVGQTVGVDALEGNEVLFEVGACIKGNIPNGCRISHKFGKVSVVAGAAYATATIYSGPCTLKTQDPLELTGVNLSARQFESVSPVACVDTDLPASSFAHYIEISDGRVLGGANMAIEWLSIDLWFRSIHHADLLRPYDPQR